VCYEILLEYSYEHWSADYKKSVRTGRYLYNGKVYTYNPMEYAPLHFDDELMQRVVNNGELCLLDSKNTVYVYKYENEFYWVMGDKFAFNTLGKTYISYHVGTSMPEKLPEEYQKYEFINKDFYFEDKEYKLEEETPYRVAVNQIPTEFPTIYYYTALYDEMQKSAIWKAYINPTYEFN